MATKKEIEQAIVSMCEKYSNIVNALDYFKTEADNYIYEAQCAIENLDGLSYDIDDISSQANDIIALLQEKGILKDGD
tara:strand:- start:7236 stop:7469 length:234 start_codon:yes stop_codon:yes gene_type:complete